MPRPNEHQLRFVQYLCGLAEAENRAALAALRRGLGKPPGTTPEMFRYVEPWLPSSYGGEDHYLVAALFALHPASTDSGNLGTTFAQVRHARGGTEAEDSLEKRFVALLNSHQDDLPDHLRHAVSLARGHAPVNYAQLLADLAYWDHPDRFVQRQWARAYWSASDESPEGPNDPNHA